MSGNVSNLRMKRVAVGLSTAIALIGVEAHAFANVIPVTSCADDDAKGTLRQVIAKAASGDRIDMSGLSCRKNKITLIQGEIPIAQDIALFGNTGRRLTIEGGSGRVLHSTSTNLSIVNLTVSGGSVYTKTDVAEGGCILAAGRVNLLDSTVSKCVAASANASVRGGAISALSVSLVSSNISGSVASSTGSYQTALGGGVYAASLSCTDSTVSGNRATAESSGGYGQGGGALIPNGDLELFRCTIDSNIAGEGGGIMQFAFGESPPMTRILNSTISGNTATFAVGGVEVFCTKCTPQPVQLLNSTLVFNSSPTAYGDGLTTNGSVSAQSSIIANNGLGQGNTFSDLFATDLTGADNLVMATNVKSEHGVVTVTDDPWVLPLACNGGPTWTHGLSPFSPARHLGNNSELQATDQRGNGFLRTTSGMVDIGAYQIQRATKLTEAAHSQCLRQIIL